jgi:hypothetical protein
MVMVKIEGAGDNSSTLPADGQKDQSAELEMIAAQVHREIARAFWVAVRQQDTNGALCVSRNDRVVFCKEQNHTTGSAQVRDGKI